MAERYAHLALENKRHRKKHFPTALIQLLYPSIRSASDAQVCCCAPAWRNGISGTCLINVQRNHYSVPCELAGKMVSARLYPSQVVVVSGDAIVACHERLTERGYVRYDWQHYIALAERKPGALRDGAPFADMPAPLKQLRHGLLRDKGGDRVMAQVLAAVPRAGLEAVLVAVELVIESGVLSVEHVLNVLGRLNAAPTPPCVETSLRLKDEPLADTRWHDDLRHDEEEQPDAEEFDHAA